MTPEEKQLLEESKALVKDLRDKHEEFKGGFMTKADWTTFEKKVNDRLDEIEIKVNRPPVIPGNPDKKDGPSPEMKVFGTFVRKGEGVLTTEEQKVMRLSDDQSGGYVAPLEFSSRIITKLTEISNIRPIASVLQIGGSGVEWPKEGTDTVTVAWEDETLAAGDYKWKMEKTTPKELKALITIKKTLLEDAYFNLEEYLVRKTSEKFQKKEGVAFISGPGTAYQPEGMLTNGEVPIVVSGVADAIAADGLVNLCYDLPDTYARNARFAMSRKTVGKTRLLKDKNDQYLWQAGLQPGQPSTLLGYPITELVDMPAVAANAYPVLFGAFNAAYQIVDRINIEVQRLVEVYATQGLIGFLFRKRTDAQVILPEALRKLKIAAA